MARQLLPLLLGATVHHRSTVCPQACPPSLDDLACALEQTEIKKERHKTSTLLGIKSGAGVPSSQAFYKVAVSLGCAA